MRLPLRRAPLPLHGRDAAVSPVIAVILMVAITIVLAATVYTWTASLSQESRPANTVALAHGGPLDGDVKRYVVAAATPGLQYTGVKATLDGSEAAYDGALCAGAGSAPAEGRWAVCNGGVAKARASMVTAGDEIVVERAGIASQTFRLVDVEANSVLMAVLVR